jgi:hypothetical protein
VALIISFNEDFVVVRVGIISILTILGRILEKKKDGGVEILAGRMLITREFLFTNQSGKYAIDRRPLYLFLVR